MKHHHWLTLLASGAVVWTALNLAAEDTAVVQAERVNVRGRPSMLGEVITQLKHGETVTVLEEIPVAKPKAGEPPKWARIRMPENTPLWVKADLIDPTNKTVKVTRLNVRAGAGENYSVVGRLEKDALVKEIRVVDDWMEIETPPGAYAFVAADLIAKKESAAPPPAPVKVVETPKPAAPVEPPKATPPSAVPEKVKTEPPPAAPVETPAAAKPEETPPTPKRTNPHPAPPVAAPGPVEPKVEGPPPKRIVRREGYVRRTVSIQAPTDFELRSSEGGVALDYLHSASTNVLIKKFKGKKVIVSGEEFIDERWPGRPVLEIDTIQVAP